MHTLTTSDWEMLCASGQKVVRRQLEKLLFGNKRNPDDSRSYCDRLNRIAREQRWLHVWQEAEILEQNK